MSIQLLPLARVGFRDRDGKPLVGGTVEFYAPGTSTLRDTYSDAAGTLANTHPVVLDARGEAAIWGRDGTYRQVVKDSLGNLIWDAVTGTPSGTTAAATGLFPPTGIDLTGTTDSTAAIMAAVAAASAAGGGIVDLGAFGPGRLSINRTITIAKSGVRLIGLGRGANHDVVPLDPAATTLVWTGADGGTMIACQPAPGGQKLTDVAVTGICLQSGTFPYSSAAGIGLLLSSVQNSTFDVHTVEFKAAAVVMTVTDGLSEAANCEGNTLSQRFRQINTAGTALQLGGDITGNACHNLFPIIYGYINNGIGIDLQNADNNLFESVWVDRINGGSGVNLYFRGAGGPRAGGAPGLGGGRTNTLQHFSQSIHSGLIYSEGTETTGVTSPAFGNRVEYFDTANTTITTQTGTGASFFYGSNTQPPGMRASVTNIYNGYRVLADGLVLFWGTSSTSLTAGTTTTITLPFPATRILDVDASLIGAAASGGPATQAALSGNTFTLTAAASGSYAFRGYALWP